MLTMNDTIGRIDYVRVICRVAPGYTQQWETRMMECVPAEYRVDAATFKKHGKLVPIYDGKMRRTTKVFEIWGAVAGMVFVNLAPSDYADVTRVDWRHEIPTPPIDVVPLLEEISKVKTNARRTKKFIDSPIRTKEDGRDAGGVSVIVGAQGSRRRLAIYKRSSAPWALEVQFGDKQPLDFYNMARASVDAKGGAADIYTQYILCLVQAYRDAVADLTGHTYGEFAHLEFWQQQSDMFNSQEKILHQVDELWNRLDPEAQGAFITANIAPNGRYGVPVETPDEIMREIGEMQYEDAMTDRIDTISPLDAEIEAYDEYTQGDW